MAWFDLADVVGGRGLEESTQEDRRKEAVRGDRMEEELKPEVSREGTQRGKINDWRKAG